MRRALVVFLCFGMLLVVCGCAPDPNDNDYAAGNRHNVYDSGREILRPNTNEIVNYNNGIYYFPFSGADFGNALSVFTHAYSELEQISIAPDVAGGHTIGYFVTFRPKKAETQ